MPKFCHQCGKQVVVGAKFCGDCGTNLSSLSSVPPPPEPAPVRQQAQSTFSPFAVGADDDDDYIDRIARLDIRINKLEVDVADFNKPVGETVGAVMIHAEPPRPIVPPADLKIDEKAFLESFRQEAGARKPNERTRSVEVTG